MQEKIGFIINPMSGVMNKKRIPRLIDQFLDKNKFIPEIALTAYAGHAKEIAKDFAARGFKYVVAVGGDGTVNEVGSALRDSDTAMGIIPSGSGNGMARHLQIPTGTIAAIKLLNRAKVIDIDYCLINERPFFCTCGVGFDAFVSKEFKNIKGRGLLGYLKKTVSSYIKFEPQKCTIIEGEQRRKFTAFDITVANASQWGNNAYIAPEASVRDKRFNVVVLSEMPFMSALDLAYKLMTKKLKNESYLSTWQAEEITIQSKKKLFAHLDGEVLARETEFRIKIIPRGLKVLCHNKAKI